MLNKIKFKRMTEKQIIFNVLLEIYVFIMILDESNFAGYTWVNKIITIGKLFILCGLVGYFFKYQNKIKKDVTFYALLMLLFINVIGMAKSGTEINTLLFIVFILASYKNDLEYIYKNFLLAFCFSILVVIISSKIGIIEDMVNIRYGEDFLSRLFFYDGGYVRHSFGFLNNNQIPFYLMTCYVMLVAWKKDKLKWYIHLIIEILNVIIFVRCGSRFVFGIIVLMNIVYYIVPKMNKKVQNIVLVFGKYAFIFFMLLSIISVIGYKKIPFSVDAFFNFRFTYAYRIIQKNGIHLLGMGFGINTVHSSIGNYEVLDNGYLALLVQRGIIFGGLLIYLWSKTAFKAARKHNIYLMFALLLLACENFIDYQILSFKFIPLLFVLYNLKDMTVQVAESKTIKRDRISENEKI